MFDRLIVLKSLFGRKNKLDAFKTKTTTSNIKEISSLSEILS